MWVGGCPHVNYSQIVKAFGALTGLLIVENARRHIVYLEYKPHDFVVFFFFLHTFLILHLFIIANTVLSNDLSTMPSCLILLSLDLPSSWNPPFVGYPGGAATKGTYRYCKRPELSSHHPHFLVPRSLELQFTGVCHTLLASAGTATHGHTRP